MNPFPIHLHAHFQISMSIFFFSSILFSWSVRNILSELVTYVSPCTFSIFHVEIRKTELRKLIPMFVAVDS